MGGSESLPFDKLPEEAQEIVAALRNNQHRERLIEVVFQAHGLKALETREDVKDLACYWTFPEVVVYMGYRYTAKAWDDTNLSIARKTVVFLAKKRRGEPSKWLEQWVYYDGTSGSVVARYDAACALSRIIGQIRDTQPDLFTYARAAFLMSNDWPTFATKWAACMGDVAKFFFVQ